MITSLIILCIVGLVLFVIYFLLAKVVPTPTIDNEKTTAWVEAHQEALEATFQQEPTPAEAK